MTLYCFRFTVESMCHENRRAVKPILRVMVEKFLTTCSDSILADVIRGEHNQYHGTWVLGKGDRENLEKI